MTTELPFRYEVRAHHDGGYDVLGKYREMQYARNRSNNHQTECNQLKTAVYVLVVDTMDDDKLMYSTSGEYVDTCGWCAGRGDKWGSEDDCPHCGGSGITTVRTTPPMPFVATDYVQTSMFEEAQS